jgi:pre-mRNA-splicing factor 18
MNNRPDHVKRSVQGKLAAATQKQTDEYMQPFFRTLKKKVDNINLERLYVL